MANGLINLQTDLKSLRYGSETPYVTKDINNPPSSDKIGMQASKRIDDTSRIVQMLVSKPGLKYLANEALLKQASNLSKAEKAKRAKKSIAGAILSQIGGTFVGTVKIVGSTLAQVPVNGTGTHFLKGFRTDTYLQPGASPDKPGGPSAFARFFGAGGVEGAQYALRGEIVPGTVEVDNQNFVQTSRTGRELELIPSQYSYDARVLEDRNETKNTPLKGQLNSSLASDGKIISIKTSELRPIIGKNADTNELTVLGGFNIPGDNLVGVETTPTRGILTKQNLINSIPHTGSIAGDVNPDSSTNVISISSSYSNTYTGKEAKTSITNAQTGAPIPTQAKRETTVTKNYLGSIPIDASGSEQYPAPRNDTEFKEANTYTYDKVYADGQKKTFIGKVGYNPIKIETANSESQGRLGTNFEDGKQQYFSDKTYTGRTTKDTIDLALRAQIIKTTKGRDNLYRQNYSDPVFTSAQIQDGQGKMQEDGLDPQLGKDFEAKVQLPLGTTIIPKRTTLKALETAVNTGSIDITNDNLHNTTIQDFRLGGSGMYSYDYNAKTVNKEQRVGLGNQGKRRARYKSYMGSAAENELMQDAINATPESEDPLDGASAGRDFAKFYFEIITPEGSKFLYFRAFIDSIDDSYSADWQARKYNGRAENFYTYGGFDRDISVSFNIAAASRSEMNPLYRKMVYLASATAPTYGPSGLMRGTLAKLTIGSYFSQIPGVLTSVKYSVDNNTPWEIAMGNPESGTDDDVQELPMMLKCTISFKPIHDFAPQTGLQHYFTSPQSKYGAKPFF